MRKQAQRFGAEFRAGAVTAVDFGNRPFQITVGQGNLRAKTLIVAAGASARMLGLDPSASSWGMAFPPAPPATAFSFVARKLPWSAEATPPWKKPCF